MLLALRKRGFRGFSGASATILEEVTEQSGGSLFEKAAFDAEGMIEGGGGGGCPADGEELGVRGGISCCFALVGGDGQYLPSPGDDGPDRNFTLVRGILGGEQGAAHHGDVSLRGILCQWRRHDADDSSL